MAPAEAPGRELAHSRCPQAPLPLGSESSSVAQELRKEFPSIKQRFSDTRGLQAPGLPTLGQGRARGQSFPG